MKRPKYFISLSGSRSDKAMFLGNSPLGLRGNNPSPRRIAAFSRPRTAAFTLIEILVATTLSLILLSAVIVIFGNVSNSISDSRSMLESADRLRLAEERLQMDLAGLTVTVNTPRRPENNEGYLEILEGPATATSGIAVNTEVTGTPVDSTVGDFDDILMFTTRSSGRPFIGRCGGNVVQSDVAEVAWFLRGRTLHRRVLLVKPEANLSGAPATGGYYINYDVSARVQNNVMVANTLGDLTRRECRFAHPSTWPASSTWYWTWTISGNSMVFPTLPTMNECSDSTWTTEHVAATAGTLTNLDFWTNATNYRIADSALGSGSRPSDDIILTNVIGFDVKVWDPTQRDYVDLGYNGGNVLYANAPNGFAHYGDSNSPLAGSANVARVYDTWSTTYLGTAWNNGLDDNGNGIVDDDLERTKPPPYPVPLRGVQVKIRVFEPDARQVREVTVVQDFLPQ